MNRRRNTFDEKRLTIYIFPKVPMPLYVYLFPAIHKNFHNILQIAPKNHQLFARHCVQKVKINTHMGK